MMRSMLCTAKGSHPAISEDRYVRYLVMGYEECLLWWDRHGRYYFHDKEDMANFAGMQIEQYLEHFLELWPGCEHAIIKEPWLTAHFPALARLMKEALFVVMARDPRDIAVSLLKVGAKLEKKGQDNPHPRDDMERLGKYIHVSYTTLFRTPRRHWGGRLAWVRYERLVTDPQSVVRQIAAFTKLDLSAYDPVAAWPGWDDGTVESERLGGSYRSEFWGKPVTNERIGTWREELTEDEAAIILRETPDLVKLFGYGKENEKDRETA
ncbi:MAG: sulfotransferase [Alphaproteobacteria bacterium]|jgi:hypothetical protein|nr:hypothetical protein [Rhodospirillaceae bacterium]MDG2482916.1 sulfotransferase [Alphaproteobacteria bacterium]MBT6204757.1 hypothetical protein [Rhodospirillaceae bacterium]MBT6511559.1 hypothetical protein [Rhodospirillaceae bacterium]MBT7613228.1 hypothetical protein [Rhodospirillaceae bacterium]